MKIQLTIEFHRPGRPGRRFTLLLLGTLLLAAAAPLAALAHAGIFGDVPHPPAAGSQFHDEINAIALAGITTGCSAGSPPNYCPDDTVTRKAMAAFMSRGFGRIHASGLDLVTLPTTDTATWTSQITPGLPANLLSGATAFIKADAVVRIETTNATGCPCVYEGLLFETSTSTYLDQNNVAVTVTAANQPVTMALTGAVGVTTAGVKTIEVRVFRTSGTGTATTGFGDLTLTTFPFGGTGLNVLGTGGSGGDRHGGRSPR